MDIYVKTGEKIEIESYPYGSLRCKAYFWAEFNPKYGYRTMFQTINPKNGRVNNPKKGTYCDLVVAYLDTETGHAEYKTGHLFNDNDVKKYCEFFANNFQLFSGDEVRWAYERLKQHYEGTVYWFMQLDIAVAERVKDHFAEFRAILKHGLETGENVFDRLVFDSDSLRKLAA
jgi:hypothetical protein